MNKPFLLFALLITASCFSQTYNIPFRKGKLWGFADKTGKIIIEPKYDSINPKMENFRWFVYKNGKTGVVNIEGIERLTPEYDSIFREPGHSQYNEFSVFKNGKEGYTDINGKFIIPVEYYRVSKCNDETQNTMKMTFLVQKEAKSDWTLIDEQQTELLKDIQGFRNYYRGNYKFKTGGKQGIFNVISKEWRVQPEYDSIAYFDYKDFYRPKSEYKDIKYYGVKKGQFFLFTKNFDTTPAKSNKLEDFFEKPKADDGDLSMVESLSPAGASKAEFTSLTGENYNIGKSYKTNSYYNSDLKSFSVFEEKKRYGIATMRGKSAAEFDEIKAIKYSYGDEYNKELVMVRKGKKWGIFNYKNMKPASEIAYDGFELHKRYDNFIILKAKNKIGLYEIEDDRDKETSTVIEPIYDSFKKFEYIRSNDYNYDNFNLYYFIKDGKTCPVGINGVKFYED